MKYLPVLLFLSFSAFSQNKDLPYYEIQGYPETYTAGTVAARMVDGLGFRFYWATEGLRKSDLDYTPGTDARTSRQTLDHIYEMSLIILNSTAGIANDSEPTTNIPFEEMRKNTLANLKAASDKLQLLPDSEMKNLKMIFKHGDKIAEFPFWSEISGPIADCLWHVGQIVSFRRASGNPFMDNVSLLTGKVIK